MDTPDSRCPDRRCLLTAAAVGATAVLAGCSTYGQSSSAPAAASPAASAAGAAAASEPAAAEGIVALADVPVGGGKVLADAKVVVTQPAAGTVKAFSAVCTHAGCTVTDVAGGTINCPCHGSKFAMTDGAVVAGPAPRPLEPVTVAVQGGQVVRA